MATVAQDSQETTVGNRTRSRWAWWGVAGGLAGLAATMLTDPQGSLTDAQRHTGAQVLALVGHTGYQTGAVLGLAATACVLVMAAGWQRWARRVAPTSLPAGVVSGALVASAGAMIIGYGLKGSMAIYLPGGLNADEFARSSLYPLFMMNDLTPYFAWWGIPVAAGAVAVLGLRRTVPLWLGVLSLVALLPPVVFLVATGLTAYAGIVGPVWLALVSIGLVVHRTEPVVD
jgi:hypothetical protein